MGKRKDNNKHFDIYCPVFEFMFIVFVGDYAAFDKFVKKKYPETYPGIQKEDLSHNLGFAVQCMGASFIYIKDKNDFNTITHESHHAISHMFNVCSEIRNDSQSTEEVFAYHNGWLVSEIIKKIKGKK